MSQWRVTGRMSVTKTSHSDSVVTARFVIPSHPQLPWPVSTRFDVRFGTHRWVIYPTSRGGARWRYLRLGRGELILEKCVEGSAVDLTPMVRGVEFSEERGQIVAEVPRDAISLLEVLDPSVEEVAALDESAHRIEQHGWRRVWVEDQGRFRWAKLPADPDPAGTPGN